MNKKYIIPVALIAGAASMVGLQVFAQNTATNATPSSPAVSQTVPHGQISDAKDTDQETNDDTSSVKDSDTDKETNDDVGEAPHQIHLGDKAEVDNHADGEVNDN